MSDSANIKILVVDDSSTSLLLTQSVLESKGYKVITLESGVGAFEIICKEKPDVVLLDIMMPTINGYKVLEKLKSDDGTKNIPVIFVSAKTEPEDLKIAFEKGASDYIKKPVDIFELIVKIEKILIKE